MPGCDLCGGPLAPKSKRFCSKACSVMHANRGERKKERHLRSRYGMSMSQYNDLLMSQDSACAACGGQPIESSPNHSWNYFHVDHDHATGEIRGILCGPCNLTVGFAQEDIDRLRGIVKYLSQRL